MANISVNPNTHASLSGNTMCERAGEWLLKGVLVKEGDRSCSGGVCGKEERKWVVLNRTLWKELGKVRQGSRICAEGEGIEA